MGSYKPHCCVWAYTPISSGDQAGTERYFKVKSFWDSGEIYILLWKPTGGSELFLCSGPPNLTQPHQNEENFELSKTCKHIWNTLVYLISEGISSTNGKDMPNRQKLSIIGKAFIIFVVLAFAIFCSMFVVFGIPCLVSFWAWYSFSSQSPTPIQNTAFQAGLMSRNTFAKFSGRENCLYRQKLSAQYMKQEKCMGRDLQASWIHCTVTAATISKTSRYMGTWLFPEETFSSSSSAEMSSRVIPYLPSTQLLVYERHVWFLVAINCFPGCIYKREILRTKTSGAVIFQLTSVKPPYFDA